MSDHDTLPCAGCHTPLPLEATGCQICMRARTRQEIMRGYTLMRERQLRLKRRPYKIAGAVLAAAAAGALAWNYGARIAAVAVPKVSAAVRWADDMRNPENYASKPRSEPPPPAQPPAPGEPVPPEAALGNQLFPRDPAPQPGGPAAPAKASPPRPARNRPLAKNAWRVSGTVYDLDTLAPLHGADIAFMADDKEIEKVTTDERGEYEVDLPKTAGLSVSMEAADRRPGQIVDADPPYRQRDADERRAAFEHVTDGDLGPAPLEWKRSASRVRLDLVAVPNRWTEPPGR